MFILLAFWVFYTSHSLPVLLVEIEVSKVAADEPEVEDDDLSNTIFTVPF